jgi:oxygen-dependent protoporphyrinogen oxidase
VNVTLAFPAGGFPETRGHGVLFSSREASPVRGFTWIDRKWGGRAPEGFRVVRAFMASDASDAFDGELVSAALAALRRLLGAAPEPERAWVFRWPRAMAQYTVGHLERVRAAEAAVPPGVFLAGAAYRGVGVPDVVRSGREAAARALAYGSTIVS